MNINKAVSRIKARAGNIKSKQKRAILVSTIASALVMGSVGVAVAHDGEGFDDDRGRKHSSAQATTSYTGPVETVSIAEMLSNNSWFSEKDAILEGHIIRQLSNNTFVFSDGDQELTIKLKSRNSQTFSDKELVRIKGEYDVEWLSESMFKVKQLTIL